MSKRLQAFGCLCFLLYLFLSGQAVAAECSNKLNSNKDFYIDFEIPSANLDEQVIASQANSGTRTQVIWTDNRNASEANTIVEKNFLAGGRYYVRLLYSSDKGKQGTLQYLNKTTVSGTWQLVSEKVIDLSEIKSADFRVVGNGEVSTIECAKGEPPPSPPPVNPDVCELFPGPVQTWIGNENNLFTSDVGTKISNTSAHSVGFSNAIVDMGYPDAYTPEDNVKALCDGVTCSLNGGMANKRDLLWDVSDSTEIKDKVVTDNETALPGSYFISSFGAPYSGLTIEPSGNLIFPTGEYWLDRADIRGTMTVEGDVVLHVWDKMTVAGLVNTTSPSDNLTIYAYNKGDECPRPGFYPSGPPAVNTNFSVDINSSGLFNGRIYSQGPVALSNNTGLRGAVTACQLQMSNTAQIVGNSQCFNPPDNNYQLVVSPERALSLLCERQPVEFQVLDSSGALASQFNGEIDVTTNLTGSGQAFWYELPDGGTGTDAKQSQRFSVFNGKTQLWLKSEVIETIFVTGQLVSDGNPSAEGQYSFVPFKLQIQEQALKVVAGKPEQITVSARSCDTSAATPAEARDYSGIRTLQLSTRYTLPDSGGNSVELRDKNGNWQSTSVALNFQEGSVESELRYLDAGQTQLSLVDPNCTKAGGCSISGNGSSLDGMDLGDWTRLEGTQTVWSRPYTFALCNITSSKGQTDFSGTASGGPGFAAAGDKFSVTFKPVIWTDDLAAPVQDLSKDGCSDIETTRDVHPDWCSVQTTPNYYSVTGLPAPLQISMPDRPASPLHEEAESGLLSSSQLNTDFSSAAQAQQGVVIDDLRWSEVGSLWLQADADYLGMPVDQGVGQLGRFYPAHFVIKESAVSDAYGSFTYMNQPFSLSATVEAQNTQNQPTQNYGYFADDYQESLQLRAVNTGATGSDANNLTSRLSEQLSYQQWEKAKQTISTDTLALLRVVSSTDSNVTEPDGPYPVDFGLVVESRHDCATRGCSDFSAKPLSVYERDGATPETAAALVGDIHARYGRMRLDDVSVLVNQDAEAPVSVEYYQSAGDDFVINENDDYSIFGKKYACTERLYPSESITLIAHAYVESPASAPVAGGQGYILVKHPVGGGAGYKEQIRLWQYLGTSKPVCNPGGSSMQPWLLYNWRGQGDENPSALVTFGVYRGNDRVIYRGERNMNQFIDTN
ncbi:polymer-forming cytoskeletal protein [Photobacterium sp. WH77]|uniref:DUF6701 domain-containing protein n=1 Tax=unclassified Photobacterium TaxID=2628852 RepID=UPI001EDBA38C|nr:MULTISPECIES: DUF6701 domain-containing protein [unclassified Photobacterium]MCG2836546.1 polymer-forming cytoskeletal protein [Photobacterium sp. WH77]MCG2844327.1 polymer-forming cytoskeletal protein [Photobacterium sp. WH80]